MTEVGKLEQLLLYLLIFIIPFQIGKHFWPQWSLLSGIRIDYLSPTLHPSDIVIGLIFALFFFRMIVVFLKHKAGKIRLNRNTLLLIFLFLVLSAGTLQAKSPEAAFVGLVRVLEFLFLGMYIASQKHLDKTIIVLLLVSGVIFSSLLAFWQFIVQGSIGGIFYYLGERSFTSETPGIANVSLSGRLLLRPYATFPHPNVLAGYLLVSFLLICFLIQHQKQRVKNIFIGVSFFFASLGILLSMSRSVWVLWAVVIIIFILISKQMRKYFLLLLGFLGSTGIIFSQNPFMQRIIETRLLDESVVLRVDLIRAALHIMPSSLFLGTGLLNFLIVLPSVMQVHTVAAIQPVHNIFLLLIVECGLMAAVLVMYFIICTILRLLKMSQYVLLFLISSILCIGFFDHYFITLQQGLLLIALSFGIAWRPPDPSGTME